MSEEIMCDRKCSICGKTSQQPVLLSSNQLGPQDLDTRPPEMLRNTMRTWVLECPHCGYVAEKLEYKLKINKDYLETMEYKTCDGIEFKSKLSKIFYKKYLIEKKKNKDKPAFFAILQCAWTCDDAEDLKNSKYTRQIAIKLADKIIESDKNKNHNFLVIKADLLRRIGDFDQLIEEYENLKLENELLDKIIRFQVQKAHEHDNKCYTLEVLS